MDNKRVIIDVRTVEEYRGGHVVGSLNIPLHEIPSRIDEIKDFENPILCCASGARSDQAVRYLVANGIACENGGCWLDVNYMVSQGI